MRIVIVSAAALCLLIAAVFIGSSDFTHATTFALTSSVSLSDSAPAANANIVATYALDSPDGRESTHVSFIPPDFGVAADAEIPDGARVGTLSATTTESTSNGPCSDSSFLSYDLLDATTDTTDTLADDPRIPDAAWPGFADTNPANDLPDAVDKYPNFLNGLYPGLTPRARAFGFVDSSIGGINRVFNVLVFDPGTALPGLSPLDSNLGYIVVVVGQDPTAPAQPSTVSEACTTLEVTRRDRGMTRDNLDTAANEGNFVYRTNPAVDGTYTFMEYGRSVRDADNDGIENTLDTCFLDQNPGWNPRISDPINDPDDDGIPGKDDPGMAGEQLLDGTGCDPTPTTANSDEDGDGYDNRQDNCPLVANGAAEDNQADADGDGIGDACDPLVDVPDGHVHEVCSTADTVIGAGGSPPTLICPDLILDEDNDGFDTSVEQHVGTDPHTPCGGSGWPADLFTDPPSDNDVDVQDLTSFLAPVRHLNTSPGEPGYDIRWDIYPGAGTLGDHINIQDLTVLLVVYPPMLDYMRAFDGPSCPYP